MAAGAKAERVHTFVATIKRETTAAFQVDCDEVEEYFWLPKSMIHEPEAETLGVDDQTEITIPYWLAQEKGVV